MLFLSSSSGHPLIMLLLLITVKFAAADRIHHPGPQIPTPVSLLRSSLLHITG
jgi:hypothetical protein